MDSLAMLNKNLQRVLIASTLCLALPAQVNAFGLKTHIWIGKKILAETQLSCRVNVQEIPISINAEVCQSIRANPKAFLSGVLGPDAYPDLITGQVTTHPGIPGDWQTADWLIHLYARAERGPRLAFAAGYLVHAASDVFAHTYVNAYSGDIFNLSDERAVERRHFVLEKYIDSHLPDYSFKSGSLEAPADWLRDKLIHNSDAARNSAKSGVALHIASMNSLYVSVAKLAKQLDQVESEGGRLLSTAIATIVDGESRISSGTAQLEILRKTLEANQKKLILEKAAFDAAERVFQDAIKAIEDKKDLINQRALEARLAREAAEIARNIGLQAIEEERKIQAELISAQQRILNTPATVSREICENHKETICKVVCWGVFSRLCNNACNNVTKTTCKVVTQVNEVYTGLTGKVGQLQTSLNNQRARAQGASLELSTQLAIEAVKLREKAEAESLIAGLEATKATAEAAFLAQRTQLALEEKATNETNIKIRKLETEIEKIRNNVVNTKSIKDSLADLIERSDMLSGLAKNWVTSMDVAGKQYILTATNVADGMLSGKSHVASSYIVWLRCYGQAYGGIPVQLGESICQMENFYSRVSAERDKIVERVLPPPFDDLYGRYLMLKKDMKDDIGNKVSEASLNLGKLAVQDQVTLDFIDLLANPENATKAKLDEVYSTDAGSKGKPLLTFGKVSDLIDADMAVKNGKLNPQKFLALKNAVTLSKLALADNRSIQGLIWVLGGDPDLVRTTDPSERRSVLFDMVRSIDGNHQWQPYGLPYPSANGQMPRPMDPEARRFGYGPNQSRPGFLLFINPLLRKHVFLKIFEGPVSGSLATKLVGYPFPECVKNPFPVAFSADGSSRQSDFRCTDGSAAENSETPFELLRRITNRIRLNPYDPF